MVGDDIEVFCSDTSNSNKILALKRILHVSINGFDFVLLSQRFHEICMILFHPGEKALLTDASVSKDILAILKVDTSSSTSLPNVLRSILDHAGSLIDARSPYFVLSLDKLPNHIQNFLSTGEIELLPPFFRKRIATLEDPTENRFSTNQADYLPRFEIHLDILYFYLYWFIEFPRHQKSLDSIGEVKKADKIQPPWTIHNLISPKKKTSEKPETKTENVYFQILKDYLSYYVPYEANNTQNAFLELIIASWLDYGTSVTSNINSFMNESEIPSKACLDSIKIFVTYAVSDPGLCATSKSGNELVMKSGICREVQKPLYDFINESFSILSNGGQSKSYNAVFDIWMAYIIPWKFHELKNQSNSLSENWILFIKQNLLFYLTPTTNFLEHVKMNINTATREQDLQLLERFIEHFLDLNLYEHIRDIVDILCEVQTGGAYLNQTADSGIFQRHWGTMDVNIIQYHPLFTDENTSLPLAILRNLSNDIIYSKKYLPENSQVSRITKAAEQFAVLFNLEPQWQKIKPRKKLKTSSSGREGRVHYNDKRRLLDSEIHYDYWMSPLMSFENEFVARKAYYLAVWLRDRYHLPELPRIRWMASYKVWLLISVCLVVLYFIWKVASWLASLIIG